MHKNIKKILIFLFVISINYKANSQVIDLEKNDLLNGRLYQEVKTNIEGHPYLFDNKFYKSSIVYKGKEYANRLIKYNIHNQEVIFYQAVDSTLPRFIKLNQNYLNEFRIKFYSSELTFTNKFSQVEGLPKEIKYYELVHNSKIKYLIGNYKSINELSTIDNKDEYILEESHFLIIDNILHKIKNKRDIYSIYKKDKNKIKAFIKSKHLNISIKNRYDLIELLIYCESL